MYQKKKYEMALAQNIWGPFSEIQGHSCPRPKKNGGHLENLGAMAPAKMIPV